VTVPRQQLLGFIWSIGGGALWLVKAARGPTRASSPEGSRPCGFNARISTVINGRDGLPGSWRRGSNEEEDEAKALTSA
jgi:hypothetical protein